MKVKGVKVTLGKTSFVTLKNGKYTVATQLWPATKYSVTFSKKGYKTLTKKITSSPGGLAQALNVVLKKK
jgi:hypothetical protein